MCIGSERQVLSANDLIRAADIEEAKKKNQVLVNEKGLIAKRTLLCFDIVTVLCIS